jgi:hypothetical protein
MMLILAILCTLLSHTVADSLPPAAAPAAALAMVPMPEDFKYDPSPFTKLPDANKQLQLLKAEQFTDLTISIFRKIFFSRANTRLLWHRVLAKYLSSNYIPD